MERAVRGALASVLVLVVGGALLACTPVGPSSPTPTVVTAAPTLAKDATSPPTPAPVGPTVVATGLQAPWSVVFAGNVALVSERGTARVLELAADGTTREVGTVEGVVATGEGGLLGLAVDAQDRLYAYSTGADGNRIERFTLTGGPGSYGLGSVETIVDGLPSAGVHNGGRIAFGPDGMLYAGVGDAGERSSAQDLDRLGGKILRLTPDGDVPADNPFPGSPVYSYGHRNVQGLAWAADGTMIASEFGQDTWDELNVIVPGGNYGWPQVEGAAGVEGFVDPVQQWNPDEASPSGIAVADGTVLVANLRGQVLRAVPVADLGASSVHLAGELGRLRAVAVAPDGRLWVVTNNTDGRGTPREGDDRIVSLHLPLG
ncbi:PQQ-dependent sugar dehydrogenase [Cellulomonas soli]|uniref:PQQ-dependent sugar dehydrogenase n=1 Tax=Cellulomonas soli TaxID=931535 RepID=UPI003F860CEC